MSRGEGGKSGKAGRHVTADEAALWRQLTRSVDKVKSKPRVVAHVVADGADAAAPAPRPTPSPQRPARRPHAPALAAQAPPIPLVQAPLPRAEFDRRTLRQVAAGKVPIDDVLDLHGLRQEEAHARLRAFLVSCRKKGHRMALVITGKGAAAEQSAAGAGAARGVLRRIVPQWLDAPEFRAVVLSYASAGVRHGGDGALYIRLRKARDA